MQIRRRRVFFIEGYEPKGADGFHRLFRREWNRFRKNWGVTGKVHDVRIDSDDIASWEIETVGPNWQVATHYEFLRLEPQIRANLSQPMWLQLARTLRWMADDFATGSLWRVFGASWRMGVLLSYSQVLLLLWFASAIAGGWLAAGMSGFAGLPAAATGIIAALGIFALLRPIAGVMFVNQLNNCWPYLREFARGKQTDFDRSVELLAKRLVAASKAGDADEILLVGHSAGAMLAMTTLRLALEMDSNLGIRRANVALVTVGSIMPLFAMHPAALKLRDTIAVIAKEPTVMWADCQSGGDFMNFSNFDPVAGCGVEVGAQRRNPTIWQIPFREMISERTFQKMRFNYWRKHYQYIMSNERRAAYDYFMFVCGPAPFSLWAAQDDIGRALTQDGSYRVPDLKAAE